MILHSEWRELPRLTFCAHPTCHRSLTDDEAVRCPHDLPLCGDCVIEDACLECALVASAEQLGLRVHPTSPAAYAWPDDSLADFMREDRDHEAGARVLPYSEKRDSA